MAILDLLVAAKVHSINGLLYGDDCDAAAYDEFETLRRTLVNDVYCAINE